MVMLERLMEVINDEWNNITITFAEPWEIPWTVYADERDDYEIYLLEKGAGKFILDGAEYPVKKGDVMLIHTKAENSFVSDGSPFRFLFVTFKIDNPANPDKIGDLNRLINEANGPVAFDDWQNIQGMLYQMQKEFCLKSAQYMFKIKLLLGNLVTDMILQYEETRGIDGTGLYSGRNANQYINRVVIYLQNHYNRNISLEELGRAVNLHPRYLCTIFRQVSGKTIGGLLREIRLEKAKRLLLNTDLSITETAMEAGFADSQYFSRVFSRYENKTPTEYRKGKRR